MSHTHSGPIVSTFDLLVAELHALQQAKGLAPGHIEASSVMLGEALGIDSLDLATLVVSLEEQTGLHPFEQGFVMFKTVGELVQLFSRD